MKTKNNKTTFIVMAYRWGNTNECFPLFASNSEEDCIKAADHYPDYRGGKYGCAVMRVPNDVGQAMNGDSMMEIINYFPSLHGEYKPSHNHRCDVFNGPICAIINDVRYDDAPEWIRGIIIKAEDTANRRNEMEARKA